MMILKLAWKNIWRSPIRSRVVIASVLLGIWAGIYMIAFSNGLNQQRLADQLGYSIGHIKVTNPKFDIEKLSNFYINDPQSAMEILKANPKIKAFSPRVNLFGMATSSSGGYGVDIYGVHPELENKVFGLDKKLKEGTYLEAEVRNPIVIGEKLAKRLKLKLRSKLVLNLQNLQGDITLGAFRVVGIYNVNSTAYEESHVFVKADDLRKLLDSKKEIYHQIVCKVEDYQQAAEISKNLIPQITNNRVQSWEDIAPELAYINRIMVYFFLIFMGVILLALSMGILNTMMMAVLERTQELGMLMAIGMSKIRIFLMIMTETILLTCTGLPIGLGLAWLSIYLSAYYGIDLSAVGQGFASAGFGSFVRPSLSANEYIYITLMVFIAAILSAIYPAWKALKLRPAEAIRKI